MDFSNFVFFCSHNRDGYSDNKDRAVFSQWRYSKFTDENGIAYNSCEQYMMYQKAILMKDLNIAKNILSIDISEKIPTNESGVQFNKIKKIKDLGRLISNFNQKLWDENKCEIVRKGNMFKFTQNQDLKNILLATGDKYIVEASHYDNIWGIGLSESQAKKLNPEQVLKNGQNLLGKSLMWVRDEIRKSQ